MSALISGIEQKIHRSRQQGDIEAQATEQGLAIDLPVLQEQKHKRRKDIKQIAIEQQVVPWAADIHATFDPE